MKRPKVKEHTVFVLGAGSAVDLGFPTGAQLVAEAVSYCRNFSSQKWVSAVLGAYAAKITQHRQLHLKPNNISESDLPFLYELATRFKAELVSDFALDLARSSSNTIDFFLGRNPRYAELGKFCIASILAMRENPFASVDRPDNWYQYLINNIYWKSEDLMGNGLDFLTFNYDLSLEFFLLHRLIHFCQVQVDPAIALLQQRNIHHVYGTIGAIGGGYVQNTRKYGTTGWDQIMRDSSGVRIVQEERSNEAWAKDREIMADYWHGVKSVYFLGFGFDPLNIRKLHLEENMAGKSIHVHLHSPTADLEERVRTTFATQQAPWPHEVKISSGGTITDFLRKNPPWK